MATKVFCDGCGDPMEPGPRLEAKVTGSGKSRLVRIESLPSDNDGDFCSDCIVDTLFHALRTPEPEPALEVDDLAPLKAQPERDADGGFSAVPRR